MSFKKYNPELLRLALLQGDRLLGHDTHSNTFFTIAWGGDSYLDYYGTGRLGNRWRGSLCDTELEDPNNEWEIR